MLSQTNGLAGKVSKSASQKDTARLELQAVVHAPKANYPETFEDQLRAWGFRKERY